MLDITLDLKPVEAMFGDLAKRVVPYAARSALNKTGREVKNALSAEARRAFDRPKSVTVNSFFLDYATKTKPQATVKIKDLGITPPLNWMRPQIEGGSRKWTAFERRLIERRLMPRGWHAVPASGMPLDAYGNWSSGKLRQILSQFRAQPTSGYESRTGGYENEPGKRRRTLLRQGFRVFAMQPGGRFGPGIYAADLFGRNVTPLVKYVRGVTYKPRMRYHEVSTATIVKHLEPTFAAEFKRLSKRFGNP